MFESFISNIADNTLYGTLVGLSLGVVLLGKHKFTRYAALGAGFGGGIALNQCAREFNIIKNREQRVQEWLVQEDKDDYAQRIDTLRAELF